MVLLLFQAFERPPFDRLVTDDALAVMKGIDDGSFFELPFDTQRGKLGWLNGAFFGRGERAIPLLIAGVLPKDFHRDFSAVLHEYWSST